MPYIICAVVFMCIVVIIAEISRARLRCIYYFVVFVQHRIGVGIVTIIKVLSPFIVVPACAAIEKVGYFPAFKLIGCSRNTKSVFTAAVCQIVAVGLGTSITANAANLRIPRGSSRNRSYIVAAFLDAKITANAANIRITSYCSSIVAVGLRAIRTANAANIFIRTRNRSCVVAVGLRAIITANAANIGI